MYNTFEMKKLSDKDCCWNICFEINPQAFGGFCLTLAWLFSNINLNAFLGGMILAKVTEAGNHYISAEIDINKLRWRCENSRVFHQRRPEVYGDIVKELKPWEVYEKKTKD